MGSSASDIFAVGDADYPQPVTAAPYSNMTAALGVL